MSWGFGEVCWQWRGHWGDPGRGSSLSPVIDVWNPSCASRILHYCVWWMQAVDPLSWRRLDAGAQLLVGWRLQVKSRTETLRRLFPGPPLCLGCVRGCWALCWWLFFQLRGRKCLVILQWNITVYTRLRSAKACLIYELIVHTGDLDRGRLLFILFWNNFISKRVLTALTAV